MEKKMKNLFKVSFIMVLMIFAISASSFSGFGAAFADSSKTYYTIYAYEEKSKVLFTYLPWDYLV